MPEQYKPAFIKHISPFIIGYSEFTGQPNENATAMDQIDAKKYVQINGHYYAHNPNNVYLINGELIYYSDSRTAK